MNYPEILCKIWQNQQRELPDSLVGCNGESLEEVPKMLPSVANQTRPKMMWHKQTHVIFQKGAFQATRIANKSRILQISEYDSNAASAQADAN